MWTGTFEIPTTDGKRRTKRLYSKSRNEVIRKLRELKAEIAAGRRLRPTNLPQQRSRCH